jgi:hypothetical protein
MAWAKSIGKVGGKGGSPKRAVTVAILIGVYLLGRMEGEGRFTWGEVLSKAAGGVADFASAATESAKAVVGM